MRFPQIAFVFIMIVLAAFPLIAQSPNGTINGLVLDPSNRVIASADILVINDVTGVKYSSKTNDDGIYVVPNLPPGPYRLQVSKAGFKTLIKPDIVLNVQDALSINFTLPVGAIFEAMTVEGGAPLVNTESAAVSTVIDHAYVENMPLNGRSFQDLILLTPGVVTQTPQAPPGTGLGQTGEFSVNGQRTESNSYTVDGVSANVGAASGYNMLQGAGPSGSVPASTALGTTQALVSVDDLQEFRVQSSTYSAEYGRNPGGQFAFDTKSGTNQWHGTGYDYLRNGFVDAQDWFNDYFGLRESALRQNDFGGTFGGPIKIPPLYNGKEKTFFFVSYEGLRLAAPQPAKASFVPDLCLRGASAKCPTGIGPADAALQPALNAFPVQNGPEALATVSCDPASDPNCSPAGTKQVPSGLANYIASWSNPASINSTSIRFDHALSDNLRLFFRFSNTTSSAGSRLGGGSGYVPSVNQMSASTMRTYTAGASDVFSSGFSNEFRLNYSSNETTQNQVVDAFGGSVPADLARLSGLTAGSLVLVNLSYDGYVALLQQQHQSGAQRQWNLVDGVNLSLGRHQLKFGVDYRRLMPFAITASPFLVYLYPSESAVETNNALTVPQAYSPAYPLYQNFSAFVQDEWKVSRRLSLSLGLRWEVNPAPGVTKGLKPYAIQGASPDTWTLAPQGTALWKTTWHNFAPRLGVAYVLRNTPGREMIVRGGGGVFYDTGQQSGSYGFEGPGFSAFSVISSHFPVNAPALVPAIVNPPQGPFPDVIATVRDLQLPYTLQWNASVEQALGKSQALTLSYVGAHAARLLQTENFQPANNPITSLFYLVRNGLTSDYDSLQLQFRRRLTQGLTVLGFYSWSHCIDYGSQDFLYGYQRGNCDFDVRHSLSAAFSYDVPGVGRNGFANALLDHWGVDDRFTAHSGFPVTLSGNDLVQPDGKVYHAGLDIVPGQSVYLYGRNCAAVLQGLQDLQPGQGCPGGMAVNPSAFTNVLSGPSGNAPRNFVRGFGAWQMDIAVRRDFPIHDRVKLQFRAEAFNVFNHPNFGTIAGNFGTSTFGQATATLANSLGILSPLYQMGGPRSMQFALKLAF